ncbi:deoxyribodipyrimidine photo-lyase [Arenicella sp. 4NH20-0111]|uniref:cryptochrome/photolyase family protein n=1 Tax=Arenicella sp. 4NH20-0111 TaxID=3127648 RepID=UPI00310ADB33
MNTLHWFREDLRLLDNPAVTFAAQSGPVTFVFIFPEGLGSASYWWLHHSLVSLSSSLKERGAQLVLRTGDPVSVLTDLVEETDAQLVTWNRVYSTSGIDQGKRVKSLLEEKQVSNRSFNGQLLIEPTEVVNKQGTPFKVFTPFWRHCLTKLTPRPIQPIPEFVSGSNAIESEDIKSWALRPESPNWASRFDDHWNPGETGAHIKWADFLDRKIRFYELGRDIPSEDNTSLLSPHLAFGEMGPNQLLFDIHQGIAEQSIDQSWGDKFLSEIGWREFSRYLIVHFPSMLEDPFNSKFDCFPWGNNHELLEAWQRGQTGYPVVDAGMRELWNTGYMHNRVRMIAASFLTKHCLLHWRLGAEWFWDTLLDADVANNTCSWQWVAGCGVDASPYFRIFNPILQGEKFDGDGVYVRKWLPELSTLPNKYIHSPWTAPDQVLASAGITLGLDYPKPIVDHKDARTLALSAYQSIK